MILVDKIIQKYFFNCSIFIFILRISYVSFFKNRSGDYGFYERIVNGIVDGCGYAVQSSDGTCIPIVGHYMPGFHYLMSIFYFLGFDAKLFLIFISCLHFCSAIFLFYIIKKYKKDINLAKKIFIILTLSPLTFGFNRILLMEPLITVFSILFLAMTIKIYYEGFKLTNNITVLILLILSLYIKPTGILFAIPFIIMLFSKLGFKEILNKVIISSLIIIISISPWGIRNLSQGSKAPFTSFLESSFYPKHSDGYLYWLSTWVITEHEQANNAFVVARQPFKMNLVKNKINPFISRKELNEVNTKFNEPVVLTKEDNTYFNDLASARRKELGIIGHIYLHSMKIASLIFNPLNSWGWPLEVSKFSEITSDKINFNNFFEFELLVKVSLKFLLFIYRILLFVTFIKSIINSSQVDNHSELNNILFRSSLLILLGILYIISIHYPSLEHRFISISIPWIETTCLINLQSNQKKLMIPKRIN